MSHIVGQDNHNTEDTMVHFGVKGMRWGVRKKATTAEIKGARKRFSRKVEDFHDAGRELRKTTKRGTKARAAGEKRLGKVRMQLLNDPDRATALRMTKGEKWLALSVAGAGILGSGGLAAPVAGGVGIAAVVAGRSIASRVIEAKQRKRG